jgi:hypothetical protein
VGGDDGEGAVVRVHAVPPGACEQGRQLPRIFHVSVGRGDDVDWANGGGGDRSIDNDDVWA